MPFHSGRLLSQWHTSNYGAQEKIDLMLRIILNFPPSHWDFSPILETAQRYFWNGSLAFRLICSPQPLYASLFIIRYLYLCLIRLKKKDKDQKFTKWLSGSSICRICLCFWWVSCIFWKRWWNPQQIVISETSTAVN